jgi:hypothetical protein
MVLGTWGALFALDTVAKTENARLRAKIDSPETAAGLQQYEDLQTMRDTVTAYKANVETASNAYKSQVVLTQEYFDAIDESLTAVADEYNAKAAEAGEPEEGELAATQILTPAVVTNMEFSDNTITFPVNIITSDEFSQKYPSALVDYIYKKYGKQFAKVDYTGYAAVPFETGEDDEQEFEGTATLVYFDLVLTINNEKQLPDLPEEADEEAAASDTAQ